MKYLQPHSQLPWCGFLGKGWRFSGVKWSRWEINHGCGQNRNNIRFAYHTEESHLSKKMKECRFTSYMTRYSLFKFSLMYWFWLELWYFKAFYLSCLFPVTTFRSTSPTTTGGRTRFATICRSTRTSARVTRHRRGRAISGPSPAGIRKPTFWRGNM